MQIKYLAKTYGFIVIFCIPAKQRPYHENENHFAISVSKNDYIQSDESQTENV